MPGEKRLLPASTRAPLHMIPFPEPRRFGLVASCTSRFSATLSRFLHQLSSRRRAAESFREFSRFQETDGLVSAPVLIGRGKECVTAARLAALGERSSRGC